LQRIVTVAVWKPREFVFAEFIVNAEPVNIAFSETGSPGMLMYWVLAAAAGGVPEPASAFPLPVASAAARERSPKEYIGFSADRSSMLPSQSLSSPYEFCFSAAAGFGIFKSFEWSTEVTNAVGTNQNRVWV
jgi:hypothetical protein